jgi:hypothetical protein
MTQNQEAPDACRDGQKHIKVQEKVAFEGLSVDGANNNADFQGRPQEPDQIICRTKHIEPLIRLGPAGNLYVVREIIALPRLGQSDLSMALAVVPIRFATQSLSDLSTALAVVLTRFATPLLSDLSMALAVVPIRLP